jgi:hypothetical protein
MTDENGRYFHQSKDSLVRALHVIVDEPDRELALVKLADPVNEIQGRHLWSTIQLPPFA